MIHEIDPKKNHYIWILAILIFGLFIGWVIVIIFHFKIEFPCLWIVYSILTTSVIIHIWKIIAKWIRGMREWKIKIIGNKIEFFFFIFLFLSTYFLYFIIEKFNIWIMSPFFVFSVISASYCGWLHYIEEIYKSKKESESGLIRKKFFTDDGYLIFITIWITIWFTIFSLLLIFISPKF